MRTMRFCLVLLVAGALAVACSASSATPYGYNSANQKPAASYGAAVPAADATNAPGSQSGGATASGAAPGASSNAAAPESQIVKTGTIRVQVTALDDSITQATNQIHALGGRLAGSDRVTSTNADQGSVTYRVPVDQFENALAAMRKFGSKVLFEHTDSTPVGGQIVDLQARLANLRATEKAVQAIMVKAATIGDVLTVQQRLTDVQGQIEELSGQLAGLTDQAAYSTLTVEFVVPYAPPSYTPDPSASPSPTPIPWSAGDQAGQAAGALGQVGETTATALIWVVVLIVPVTLAFVLLLALLGFAGRKLDPYRRRLLPFTVTRPVTYSQTPMPYGSPYTPGPMGPRPEDKPKA